MENQKLEASFYKSLADKDYYSKLKEMVMESAITLEDALYYLNETIIPYKQAMEFANMGYSKEYVTKNYSRLLLKHFVNDTTTTETKKG